MRTVNLGFIASVGEPLNPQAVLWGQEAFGLPIHDNWWQTETGGIMLANFASMPIRPGSMGRPLPGVDATIVGQIAGPRVVRYELQLAPGTKVSRVASLADDLAAGRTSSRELVEAALDPTQGPALAAAQNILLIDNSLKTPNYTTGWAKWANVGIVEDLSDIDTIVGAQAPYDPNNPTQNWKQVTGSQWGWYKWYHARGGQYESAGDSGAGARNWVLVGDDRLFYLFCTNAAG